MHRTQRAVPVIKQLGEDIKMEAQYTDENLKTAKATYLRGMRVKSPMTNEEFVVDRITGTWHGTYIKGFDGSFFYDVVWYSGVWAKIISPNKPLDSDAKEPAQVS